MARTALKQKEKPEAKGRVDSQTSFHVNANEVTDRRVQVQLVSETLERKISFEDGVQKREFDRDRETEPNSFPTVLATHEELAEQIEENAKVDLLAPETMEDGIEIHPAVTGLVFVEPHAGIDPEIQDFTPMKSVDQERGEFAENIPEIHVLEPDQSEGVVLLNRPGEIPVNDYGQQENYYPEPEEETYLLLEDVTDEPEIDYLLADPDKLPMTANLETLEDRGKMLELTENSVVADYNPEQNEQEVSREQRIRVSEDMVEDEGTVREVVEYMIESGELEGSVMETPYYSETGGENFDQGWNTHPQIVELGGFDMDTAEYRVNGELAKDHIGNIELDPGDELEIQESQKFSSHGDYEASEETEEAWRDKYGEEVWNELDGIDRQIYSGLVDGEVTGEIDLSGRDHIVDMLEKNDKYEEAKDYIRHTGEDYEKTGNGPAGELLETTETPQSPGGDSYGQAGAAG